MEDKGSGSTADGPPAAGFYWHERCFWHDVGAVSLFSAPAPFLQPHPASESPESKRRLKNLLEVSGLIDELVVCKPPPASPEDLERFHTRRYLDELARGDGSRGGYDACAKDPLGKMLLNSAAFADMTRQLKALAERVCRGRLVMVHEGGYAEGYVPFCGHAVIQALAGSRTRVPDPQNDEIAAWAYQVLQPHQRALIDGWREAWAAAGRL